VAFYRQWPSIASGLLLPVAFYRQWPSIDANLYFGWFFILTPLFRGKKTRRKTMLRVHNEAARYEIFPNFQLLPLFILLFRNLCLTSLYICCSTSVPSIFATTQRYKYLPFSLIVHETQTFCFVLRGEHITFSFRKTFWVENFSKKKRLSNCTNEKTVV
jgi:hypothetical protein